MHQPELFMDKKNVDYSDLVNVTVYLPDLRVLVIRKPDSSNETEKRWSVTFQKLFRENGVTMPVFISRWMYSLFAVRLSEVDHVLSVGNINLVGFTVIVHHYNIYLKEVISLFPNRGIELIAVPRDDLRDKVTDNTINFYPNSLRAIGESILIHKEDIKNGRI